MALDDLATQGARGILKGLVPPAHEPSAARRRYDWTVSGVLAGVAMSLAIHIAWACGYLSFLGLPGFADAREVSQQQLTLNAIQLEQITNAMRDEKRQMCLAQRANNQSALTSWALTLEASQAKYHYITSQWPQVMSCDELLVASPPA